MDVVMRVSDEAPDLQRQLILRRTEWHAAVLTLTTDLYTLEAQQTRLSVNGKVTVINTQNSAMKL